jgi:hypothetical protein
MGAHDTNWLDALARRAATADAPGPIERPGISRRMLLRLTGAAVLAGGTMRMVAAQPALAQDSAACIKERTKENLIRLQGCQKGGDRVYKNALKAYRDHAQIAARTDLPKSLRKAARRAMTRDLDTMVSGLGDMNDCVAKFNTRQNDDKFNCQVIGPPQPRQPGDEPAQPPRNAAENGTCPGETFACTGQNGLCCYNGTFCCGCGCCIYNDCRCCVPG